MNVVTSIWMLIMSLVAIVSAFARCFVTWLQNIVGFGFLLLLCYTQDPHRVRDMVDTCIATVVELQALPTLVTLVSHSQPLWRGVTQGGVAPVFPFRANP